MLPYLEQKELFAQFHLDEPWDSPHNRQLIERRPACYASPGRTLPPGLTPWLAIVGRHAVVGDPFLCDKKWSLEGIRDGMIADPRDATGLLLEADDASLVIWTKPDDYETDRKSLRENFYWRTAGCILAFADGHVARTPHDTPDAKLQAMFTRSGQEEVAGKILDPEW